MKNRKQKWTPTEKQALHAGVTKHGEGNWMKILNDPEFSSALSQRTNVALKDKWRNVNNRTSGQGANDKSRVEIPSGHLTAAGTSPTVVAGTSPAISVGSPTATSPIPKASNSAPATPHSDGSSQMISTDLSKSAADATRYNELVFEALSSIKDVNGSKRVAIASFIEKKHEVPQNFSRLLGYRLRGLVKRGKLEKVGNRFKLCNETQMVAATSIMEPEDASPKQSNNPSSSVTRETLDKAAERAAGLIAEAEHKSSLAVEAIKEYERVYDMYQKSKFFLEFVEEIYERRCRGEVIILG